MNNLFRFSFILLFSLSVFTASIAHESPKIGKTAPEISITEWVQGKTVLKGKTVFLTFFETWCGNCRRIVKQMNELAKKYSVIKVLDIKEAYPMSFSKAKGKIQREIYTQKKKEREKEWLEDLRKTHHIIIYDDILKSVFSELKNNQ